MRTRIKICGCTSVADAELAVAAGADAVGVIFAPSSPRRVDLDVATAIAAAMPAYVQLVGVFVDPEPALVHAAAAAGYAAQFSGRESAALTEGAAAGPYVKVYHVASDDEPDAAAFATFARAFRRATWMFEAKVAGMDGGTGRTFAWHTARLLAGARPIVVSGGLTPANVAECVRAVRPHGVDVRSGVETNGVKDTSKMRAFVRAVREADAQA